MLRCPVCETALGQVTAYCPACGSSLQAQDDGRTVVTGSNPTPSGLAPPSRYPGGASSAAWIHGSSSGEAAGFAPGAVLGGRFRIIGMLGRGGMGEVYRADDLLLGQPVALKFLPRELATDTDRQARFFGEVRIARQVSHPNICRVYDVGEIDGQPYLTMELIEGDDLASLLRRIGRLPEDKALDVARQLCAGLAAAHERGVLHRDLKPANILIDAQGKARITDFGLAVLAGQVSQQEKRAGTPAYMAPEQLAHNQVSVRSDVYGLGLVLYEMFTGRRAFEADTLVEVERLQRDSMPASPSTILADLDPVIERAILRCLDKDPANRPENAIAVAASLPGGDPLAAALAAGELPSPEIVAAAGGAGVLGRRKAWAALAMLGVALAALLAASGRYYFLPQVPVKAPAVLQERALETLAQLGYPAASAGRASGLVYNREYWRWVKANRTGAGRWDGLRIVRTGAVQYWFRQSPRPMVHWDPRRSLEVSPTDPPALDSGMTTLFLDPAGRLLQFTAVPPQVDSTTAPAAALNWNSIFQVAGLDSTLFTRVAPQWSPDVFCDRRMAWAGRDAELPGVPLRLEAGAYRGRVCFFRLVMPWTRPERMAPRSQSWRERLALAFASGLVFALMFGSVAMARRNILSGHGDRRGAFRLALMVLGMNSLSWILTANHAWAPDEEWNILVGWLGLAIFVCGFVYVLYLALEPYVRRRWPDSLIAWNRLLAGRFRDPRVGRDVLLGLAGGALIMLVRLAQSFTLRALGRPGLPETTSLDAVLDPKHTLAAYGDLVPSAIFLPMAILFLLILFRRLVRQPQVATALVWVVFALLMAGNSDAGPVGWGFALLQSALFLGVLLRLGLLAAMAANLVLGSFSNLFVLTADTGSWYAPAGFLVLGVVAAAALWAFRTSQAGAGLRVRAASR